MFHEIHYHFINFVVPPGNPQLSGPSSVIVGYSVTLTCSTRGGDPTPSVIWYRSTNKGQPVDQTATTSNGVTTNDYTFVANNSDHHAVFECQVDNSILENALVATWFFDVYSMFYYIFLILPFLF